MDWRSFGNAHLEEFWEDRGLSIQCSSNMTRADGTKPWTLHPQWFTTSSTIPCEVIDALPQSINDRALSEWQLTKLDQQFTGCGHISGWTAWFIQWQHHHWSCTLNTASTLHFTHATPSIFMCMSASSQWSTKLNVILFFQVHCLIVTFAINICSPPSCVWEDAWLTTG